MAFLMEVNLAPSHPEKYAKNMDCRAGQCCLRAEVLAASDERKTVKKSHYFTKVVKLFIFITVEPMKLKILKK
jgi:hypothetical protein